MTTFFLVRHGLTDAVDHVITGRAAGVHLNETGRRDAARVADCLADIDLSAIASSPLERALETAAPLAVRKGLAVEQIEDLTEFDVGEWAGRRIDELHQEAAWRRFNEARSVTPAPGGESMLDVQRRGVGALLALRRRYSDARVAVVSHGDVIRAVLLFALGMPLDFVHRIDIRPAAISVIELGEALPRVRLMNADTVPEGL